MSEDTLDAVAVRVLGSLMEKQVTTPANYPLTLNALTAACNQSSNRDPVMALAEAEVLDSLADLTRRSLVRSVFRSDSRAKRYRHLVPETLNLHDAEAAVLCVLLLRGAQTAGEIRTRTTRLFEFRDMAHVDVTLRTLMTLSRPLVAQLPRQPGQKEVRYAHLLSGEPGGHPDDAGADAAAAVPMRPAAHQPVPDSATSSDLASSGEAVPPDASRLDALEGQVAELRSELQDLRAVLDEFRRQFE